MILCSMNSALSAVSSLLMWRDRLYVDLMLTKEAVRSSYFEVTLSRRSHVGTIPLDSKQHKPQRIIPLKGCVVSVETIK